MANEISQGLFDIWMISFPIGMMLRPKRNGRHFRRRRFQIHFLEWKCMNFDYNFTEVCSRGPINDIPALVQIMACRRPGDKPLSETMMVSLPTRICVTRPQWGNGCVFNETSIFGLINCHCYLCPWRSDKPVFIVCKQSVIWLKDVVYKHVVSSGWTRVVGMITNSHTHTGK